MKAFCSYHHRALSELSCSAVDGIRSDPDESQPMIVLDWKRHHPGDLENTDPVTEQQQQCRCLWFLDKYWTRRRNQRRSRIREREKGHSSNIIAPRHDSCPVFRSHLCDQPPTPNSTFSSSFSFNQVKVPAIQTKGMTSTVVSLMWLINSPFLLLSIPYICY